MNFMPIRFAPKDQRILLYYVMGGKPLVICGKWDEDAHARKPSPCWHNDMSHLWGKTMTRNCQPTFFAFLEVPAPESLEQYEITLQALGERK